VLDALKLGEPSAAARFIQMRASPPAGYRVDPAPWRDLLELSDQPPAWRSWHERFAFATAFLAWAQGADVKSIGAYALGSRRVNSWLSTGQRSSEIL
jgi:hypothetical protein